MVTDIPKRHEPLEITVNVYISVTESDQTVFCIRLNVKVNSIVVERVLINKNVLSS